MKPFVFKVWSDSARQASADARRPQSKVEQAKSEIKEGKDVVLGPLTYRLATEDDMMFTGGFVKPGQLIAFDSQIRDIWPMKWKDLEKDIKDRERGN